MRNQEVLYRQQGSQGEGENTIAEGLRYHEMAETDDTVDFLRWLITDLIEKTDNLEVLRAVYSNLHEYNELRKVLEGYSQYRHNKNL